MKFCHCALPALTGNSDCCKNCPNNQNDRFNEFEPIPSKFDINLPTPDDHKETLKQFEKIKQLY